MPHIPNPNEPLQKGDMVMVIYTTKWLPLLGACGTVLDPHFTGYGIAQTTLKATKVEDYVQVHLPGHLGSVGTGNWLLERPHLLKINPPAGSSTKKARAPKDKEKAE